MKNAQRVLVKIIQEICSEEGIQYESFSYDWIMRLTKNEKTVHLYGYHFENNSATAQLICTDKCATYELLNSCGIPAVEHKFFINPDDFQYIGVNGNWDRMLALLKEHRRLVCKPNDGTGGIDAYLVSTAAELEVAAAKIFAHHKSMAISPFIEIEQEYRVILLNRKVMMIFSKSLPMLTGDGVSTVRQLALRGLQAHAALPFENSMAEDVLGKVLAAGEKMPLSWKHNLGQGAMPEIISEPSLVKELTALALRAVDTVNIQFASVDIIKAHGQFKVLEINSGVMMENFARSSSDNYLKAKAIYKEALDTLFNNQ